MLNLIKKAEPKKKREVNLGEAFANAVNEVNRRWKEQATNYVDVGVTIGRPRGKSTSSRSQTSYHADTKRLIYLTYDFLGEKAKGTPVTAEVTKIAANMVNDTGFFIQSLSEEAMSGAGKLERGMGDGLGLMSPSTWCPPGTYYDEFTEQKGIIRVNCIDCLDRTNVAQYCVGKIAMKKQLAVLGILPDDGMELPLELSELLQSAYMRHGDRIVRIHSYYPPYFTVFD